MGTASWLEGESSNRAIKVIGLINAVLSIENTHVSIVVRFL